MQEPMNREEALRCLREHSSDLTTRFGVISLSLFGSIARDDAAPDSDLDLLVEFDRPIGLFAFARVQQYLEDLVGRRVDLVTPEALRPSMRRRVEEEAIRAA